MGIWGKISAGMDGSGIISTKMNGSKKWNVIISLLGIEKMKGKIKDRFKRNYLSKKSKLNSALMKIWLKNGDI